MPHKANRYNLDWRRKRSATLTRSSNDKMRAGKFEPDRCCHSEQSEKIWLSGSRRFVAFAQNDDNVAMVDRLGVLMRRARVARLRAVITAENLTVGLNAVADHATVAMAALRCKRVNRTFETVENVFPGFTFNNHFECLLIVVSANFTACHDRPPNSFESSRPIRFAKYPATLRVQFPFQDLGRIQRGLARHGCATIPAMANRNKFLRRAKPRIRRRSAVGAKPGTITIQPGAQPTTIRVMAYDKDRVVEQKIDDPKRAATSSWESGPSSGSMSSGWAARKRCARSPRSFTFIRSRWRTSSTSISGRRSIRTTRICTSCCGFPTRRTSSSPSSSACFLGKNYLVTFQERPGDYFDLVRAGLRHRSRALRGKACSPITWRIG